ncbi:CopY family transcriptional regulator [Brevundimonas sp. LM2]|uniref:BlaI/MecI/CopY family transcriptional regulator n=1 Tax=Brevundimonas sp. LM2 TaxID=1938605 RepID=UPI000983B7C7|nr:BlaI/MecI/CopY family transcriptional regulator [Brevundimonas sp. LM2]AQR61652.1 CopY family transcriptional regulator [Brevundimonas sp. LM2]
MIESLPRREREVFETLCRLDQATAVQVRQALQDAPSDSSVRTLLGRLVAKGLVAHRAEGQTYVYAPVPQPASVARSALRRLVETFFDGSAANTATALMDLGPLEPEEVAALHRAIDAAQVRRTGDRS